MGKIVTVPLPSYEELHRLLILDADAGVLIWRRREGVHESWNTKYAGNLAGDPHGASGRMRVGIDNARYLVHRVIYKMAYNKEPHEIDHKDARFTNNKPTNLRPADHGSNIANGKRRRKASNLPKGVYLKRAGKYAAYIRKNGEAHHLGYFDDVDSAHAAYCAAAVKFHGEFARFD